MKTTKMICADCGSDDVHTIWAGDEGWDVCEDCRSVENTVEVEIDVCDFCDRENEGNAGDYYHRKACEATDISRKLERATDPKEIASLKKRLEMARFVGD